MDKFNIILIVVSIIFLITYYWRQYKKWQKEQEGLTWPRNLSECPDYWVNEGKSICRNIHNLGNCPSGPSGQITQGTVDFKGITGSSNTGTRNSLLQKCRWTKRCNSTWEGVDKLCA